MGVKQKRTGPEKSSPAPNERQKTIPMKYLLMNAPYSGGLQQKRSTGCLRTRNLHQKQPANLYPAQNGRSQRSTRTPHRDGIYLSRHSCTCPAKKERGQKKSSPALHTQQRKCIPTNYQPRKEYPVLPRRDGACQAIVYTLVHFFRQKL